MSSVARLHYLQHIHFEDLANIKVWAKDRGFAILRTLLFNDEKLPSLNDFDWLVIMGGPMNIYEEKKYPWLVREKRFIEKAINRQKVVLGVCLGAQLIADILGGKVYKNKHKEIGWHPVYLTEDGEKSTIFKALPKRFIAFHWHGDTFSLPKGCVRTAESKGCLNQAFEYNLNVVGLQFHLESSYLAVKKLLQNCWDELVEGRYIQSRDEIVSNCNNLCKINEIMNLLLDNLLQNNR